MGHGFGSEILGQAFRVAEGLLSKEGNLDSVSNAPLARQIRDYVYDCRNRARYVAAATNYLREKQPGLDTDYDVILVGAGVHAAMFVYTAKKRNPGLNALIVEKSADICSTFSRLGDSLVLNSPTFSKVGLNSNFAQGHFVQVSDFDELAERQYPTAKHLHELATMILFHADADILFGYGVDNVEKTGNRYSVSSDGRTVEARSVVLTNGMGEQRKNSFEQDKRSERVIEGDDFISACYSGDAFHQRIKNARIAVVGAGDTANCVMEHLLPLTYPNDKYPSFRNGPFLPSLVHWIGQSARDIQDFYFANKQRYGHSGGIIEFFWDGEAPFDLPEDAWKRTKALIHFVPHRLDSLTHREEFLELTAGSERLEADIVVDCTGRINELSTLLLQGEYEFIQGNIVLLGGQWDERQDQFVLSPRFLEGQRIASKIRDERIFLLGCACPVDELIDNEEALDGTLKHQKEQTSLTNSKFSLEHTLPRTVAFAERFEDVLR